MLEKYIRRDVNVKPRITLESKSFKRQQFVIRTIYECLQNYSDDSDELYIMVPVKKFSISDGLKLN